MTRDEARTLLREAHTELRWVQDTATDEKTYNAVTGARLNLGYLQDGYMENLEAENARLKAELRAAQSKEVLDLTLLDPLDVPVYHDRPPIDFARSPILRPHRRVWTRLVNVPYEVRLFNTLIRAHEEDLPVRTWYGIGFVTDVSADMTYDDNKTPVLNVINAEIVYTDTDG